jgi:hypothetical protein
MAGRPGREAGVLLEGEMQMKTFMSFMFGVLVGAYAAGQVWQEEAIKRGLAKWENNQFKWKESK